MNGFGVSAGELVRRTREQAHEALREVERGRATTMATRDLLAHSRPWDPFATEPPDQAGPGAPAAWAAQTALQALAP